MILCSSTGRASRMSWWPFWHRTCR